MPENNRRTKIHLYGCSSKTDIMIAINRILISVLDGNRTGGTKYCFARKTAFILNRQIRRQNMAINPLKLLKLKEYKEGFETRHPRVVAFIERQLISGELPAGTILEVSITRPDQDKVTTNMKVAPEDVEVIRELKNL